MAHYLRRKVTKKECSWLDYDLPVGTRVYPIADEFDVCTPNGMAIMLHNGKLPYIEIPKDAVVEQHGVEFSEN